jgi:hypothetical protein
LPFISITQLSSDAFEPSKSRLDKKNFASWTRLVFWKNNNRYWGDNFGDACKADNPELLKRRS